jgi:hypothetical protein
VSRPIRLELSQVTAMIGLALHGCSRGWPGWEGTRPRWAAAPAPVRDVTTLRPLRRVEQVAGALRCGGGGECCLRSRRSKLLLSYGSNS